MKHILSLGLLTLLLSAQAHARVDSTEATGSLSCDIAEVQGRKQERYSLRFPIPSAKGEFALRLYPMIVVELSAAAAESSAIPESITLQLLDNQIEQAEGLADLVVARAEGRGVVKLYAKLDAPRQRSVTVDCRPEVELRGSL